VSSFFLLIEGYVRVVKTLPDGQQVIVRYFPTGELIGIAPAMNLSVYPASAIAVVDCILLAWPERLWKHHGRLSGIRRKCPAASGAASARIPNQARGYFDRARGAADRNRSLRMGESVGTTKGMALP
jgi:hypothetical protein